jgi:hypothetical protein
LLRLLNENAPVWLAGLLGAGIISAVMGSDAHQVLAMSTMFTKDIYSHYGGREKYGEKSAVHFARAFILVVTVIAYSIALYLKAKQGIFEIAIRFAFSGFAAMAPVMIAALFWKRSTKWGALASTLFVAGTLTTFAFLQGKPAPPPVAPAKPAVSQAQVRPVATTATNAVLDSNAVVNFHLDTNANDTNAQLVAELKAATPPAETNVVSKPALTIPVVTPPKPKLDIIWKVGDHVILSRAPATGDVRFWNSSTEPAGGYMTVAPMVFGSAICMILFSLLTKPPGRATIDKYFSKTKASPEPAERARV